MASSAQHTAAAAAAPLVERALARDHVLVIAALGVVTMLAWAWTLSHGRTATGVSGHAGMSDMRGMDGMSGMSAMLATAASPASWSAAHALLMFVMWWVMMVAMMVPGASPLVLLAAAVHRRAGARHAPLVVSGALAAGYVVVWGAFSLGATLLQWALERAGVLLQATLSAPAPVAAAILVAAGAYQLAPPKRACLRHCRSPVDFLSSHWRPGRRAAFRLGMLHGAWCVGCCWFLMALLFVGGVMNPLWIGGIALYILLEKFAPAGERLSRAAGVAMIALGTVLLLRVL